MKSAAPTAGTMVLSRVPRRKLLPLALERRRTASVLDRGAAILADAIAYLVNQQLTERREPVQPTRQEIAILRNGGRQIAHEDRRWASKTMALMVFHDRAEQYVLSLICLIQAKVRGVIQAL